MNKKGFVFLETIIVIVVLSGSLAALYSLMTKITYDIKTRKYYDNISDIYKTDIIRSNITKETITGTNLYIEITKNNCTSYMTSTCADLLNELEAERVVINLKSVGAISLEQNDFPNSMIEYLKTINTNKRYIIVNYKYDEKNYYSSLEI